MTIKDNIISIGHLDAKKNIPLAMKFTKLFKIKDGWHDGMGKTLNPDKLKDFALNLINNYPENLPLPHVFPTPDGDLFLEWEAEGDPTVSVNLSGIFAYFHAFTKTGGDIEKEFELLNKSNYILFIKFLRDFFNGTLYEY
jgi:hypothetical protein